MRPNALRRITIMIVASALATGGALAISASPATSAESSRAVALGEAGSFAAFAENRVANGRLPSVITGDVGVAQAGPEALEGFPPGSSKAKSMWPTMPPRRRMPTSSRPTPMLPGAVRTPRSVPSWAA